MHKHVTQGDRGGSLPRSQGLLGHLHTSRSLLCFLMGVYLQWLSALLGSDCDAAPQLLPALYCPRFLPAQDSIHPSHVCCWPS